MSPIKKPVLAALLLILVWFACGCEGMDVSGLLAPEAPTAMPSVTASDIFHEPPPDPNRLGNLVLDVYTARGATVRITDATVAGMLLQAMNDGGLQFESQAQYAMDNAIVIRDAADQDIAELSVCSDGDMVGWNESSGSHFRIPEWIFYQIEYYLWMKDASLYADPLVWNPQDGEGALMLRMDAMLRTMLPQAYGYADAYLTAFRLYGMDLGDYRVKIYLLVAYAGYLRDGEYFRLQFQRITPVALTLYELSGYEWRYIAYQEPKDLEQQPSVRAIFPYEYTQKAMKDMADPGDLPEDLMRKARDWLRDHGLGDLVFSE